MGKILVFLFDGITDYEITFVNHLLKADAGMDVVTVSYDGNFITEKSGLTYKVDKQLKDKNVITAIGPAFVKFGIEICYWFNLLKGEIEKEEFTRMYCKF